MSLAAAVLGAIIAFGALVQPVDAQWPAGRGSYWAKVSHFRHTTTEGFRSNGDKRPFLASNAESSSSAVFLDALVGVTNRLDLWAQVPYFDLSFNDDVDDRRSRGVGDIRVSARYNLFQLRQGSLPVSVRFTTKVPVVDFPIDSEIIPVGEGQWDYEAWLEAGLSLYPLPAYTVFWVGHRWRALNRKTTRDPGDEISVLAELGFTSLVGGLGAKVIADGIFGGTGSIQGVSVTQDEREILYVAPTLTYQFTPSILLETAARIPLRGKNFPAGNQLMIALFTTGAF